VKCFTRNTRIDDLGQKEALIKDLELFFVWNARKASRNAFKVLGWVGCRSVMDGIMRSQYGLKGGRFSKPWKFRLQFENGEVSSLECSRYAMFAKLCFLSGKRKQHKMPERAWCFTTNAWKCNVNQRL